MTPDGFKFISIYRILLERSNLLTVEQEQLKCRCIALLERIFEIEDEIEEVQNYIRGLHSTQEDISENLSDLNTEIDQITKNFREIRIHDKSR